MPIDLAKAKMQKKYLAKAKGRSKGNPKFCEWSCLYEHRSNTFYLVVFDPPHLINVNDDAYMKIKFERLTEEWPQVIHNGFAECMRVLKPYGTLIFKWSEVQIPTRKVIDAIGQEPLFGHISGRKMNTHWMTFMKIPEQEEQTE